MSYRYGATIKERVYLTPRFKQIPAMHVEKLRIVVCTKCAIGKRIVEGQTCSACVALGIEGKA